MTQNELRNQEINRHEQKVDQNVEYQQALNLNEQKRDIAVANQNSLINRIVMITYFMLSALEMLLGIRVILYLAGVNMENAFANLIDKLSDPFVVLFASLLQNPSLGGSSVLEVTTIIAMLVWAIVLGLAGRLIWLVLSRSH